MTQNKDSIFNTHIENFRKEFMNELQKSKNNKYKYIITSAIAVAAAVVILLTTSILPDSSKNPFSPEKVLAQTAAKYKTAKQYCTFSFSEKDSTRNLNGDNHVEKTDYDGRIITDDKNPQIYSTAKNNNFNFEYLTYENLGIQYQKSTQGEIVTKNIQIKLKKEDIKNINSALKYLKNKTLEEQVISQDDKNININLSEIDLALEKLGKEKFFSKYVDINSNIYRAILQNDSFYVSKEESIAKEQKNSTDKKVDELFSSPATVFKQPELIIKKLQELVAAKKINFKETDNQLIFKIDKNKKIAISKKTKYIEEFQFKYETLFYNTEVEAKIQPPTCINEMPKEYNTDLWKKDINAIHLSI